MNGQMLTAIVGGLGFAIGAAASYAHWRPRRGQILYSLRIAALLAVAVNVAFLFLSWDQNGLIETFRQNFNSTLLLACLIGLAALGTHLFAKMRGLDGFLFFFAALIDFSALLLLRQAENPVGYKPWFISHALAFVLSAACFVAGGAAGLAYLLIHYLLRKKRALTLVGTVAPLEALENFGRWMLMIGFPLFTYGILTGFCGIAHHRGTAVRSWFADPLLMSVSLITWLVYALMVFCAWFMPWLRGRRAAMLAACGMIMVALVLFVIGFESPIHR